MKSIVCLLVALCFVGCGDGINPLSIAGDNYAMQVEAMGSLCNTPISSHLTKKEVDSLGDLKLYFDNGDRAKSQRLSANASIADRCDEIASHFSSSVFAEDGATIPGGLLFEMDLPFGDGGRELVLSGKKAPTRATDIFLSYVDGSFEDKKWQINLRCPKPFLLSCQLERNEENDESKCRQYFVDFESQTCTFRQSGLPYYFSDHKFTTLDIEGEIRFSGSGAELTIGKASWLGMR